MGNIPLHPKRGLDPHLCFCPRCGGQTNDLTIGYIRKGRTRSGKTVYYQSGEKSRVEKNIDEDIIYSEEVSEGERVPSSDFCDTCKKEIEEHRKIVEAGGVYFKCKKCHAEGVIRPEAGLSKLVRESYQHQENEQRRKTADAEDRRAGRPPGDPNRKMIHDGWWTTASQTRGNEHVFLPLGIEFDECEQHTPKE